MKSRAVRIDSSRIVLSSPRIAAALLMLWAAPGLADNFNQVCAGSGCPPAGTSPNGVTVDDAGPQITFEDTGGAPRVQLHTHFGSNQGFFVYTGSSVPSNPFAIFAGAPEDALVIDANGLIGMGVQDPQRQLEVAGQRGGDTAIRVTNSGPASDTRSLLELFNQGAPQITLNNMETNTIWHAGHSGTSFVLNTTANTGNELALSSAGALTIKGNLTQASTTSTWKSGPTGINYRVDNTGNTGVELSLTPSGNLTIEGTLTESSDVNSKYDIAAVDSRSLLRKIQALPVSTWRYKADETRALHLGPMAQDFHQAFGLGDSDQRISPRDAAGVALAGVKQLADIQKDKDAEIQQLRKAVAALQERLERLERNSSPVNSGLQKTAL